MLNNKTIAVVVPAYNEEKQIGHVIDTMPDFVDRIIVVNDCSTDATANVAEKYVSNDKYNYSNELIGLEKIEKNYFNEAEIILQKKNKEEKKFFERSRISNETPGKDRIIIINHNQKSGVGASIATGYKWCKDHRIDCTAVMAGDGQMDPSELQSICKPVIEENIDYVKGNRLIHRSSWYVIPKIRFFGNSILSILTKLASGYWRISDTQTGFTAISKKALNAIKLFKIYKKYGMPNDILVKLNIAYCTIREVEIKPVYRVGEKSKMKVYTVIPRISLLLFNSFFKRMWTKYLFRDFHPMFLLYHFAIILFIVDLKYIFKVAEALTFGLNLSFETLFAFTFLTISSFQSFLFAMWMDIQDNDRLYK